ncbi:g4006 [Coccomyxa elongata]
MAQQNDLELRKQIEELKEELGQERRKSSSLAQALQTVKEQHFNMQQQVEQEEEYIANRLLKRLDSLKREKQVLATEVEQEEEYLVNNLQKRMGKLNLEKAELEKELEKLNRKCEELRLEQCKMSREKELIENQLEAEQEYIVNKLQKQAMGLAAEKQALQHEKAELKRQVGELTEAVHKLNNEKVLLEQSMEMEEEGIVNRLQRVIETVLARNKAVEACLEAHGLSIKELNPPHVDVSTEWAYARSPTRSDAQARLNSGELWSAGSGRSDMSTSEVRAART